MKSLRHVAAFAVLACSALSAHAHRPFLLPSSTILSGNAPWVSLDAAAASNVFYFDHMPLKLDQLHIVAPDGSSVTAENPHTGKFRSSFDVHLMQTGSYKLSLLSEGMFASYKLDGKLMRWRGPAENLSKDIPANAEDLQVTQRSGRIETFVTNGKPGGKALEATGKGLELISVSHPNDLFAGEPASFRFLLDGRPAAGMTVTVIAGGIRYRQNLDEKTYTTDKDGQVTINWPAAGMYWLEAGLKDTQQLTPPATARVASYAATLEVLPQ